MSKYVTVSISP